MSAGRDPRASCGVVVADVEMAGAGVVAAGAAIAGIPATGAAIVVVLGAGAAAVGVVALDKVGMRVWAGVVAGALPAVADGAARGRGARRSPRGDVAWARWPLLARWTGHPCVPGPGHVPDDEPGPLHVVRDPLPCMAWALFSLSSLSALVSRLPMPLIARPRLTPTVFGTWMFVVTRLRTPI